MPASGQIFIDLSGDFYDQKVPILCTGMAGMLLPLNCMGHFWQLFLKKALEQTTAGSYSREAGVRRQRPVKYVTPFGMLFNTFCTEKQQWQNILLRKKQKAPDEAG